jgi:hypothetical protein
MDKITRDQFVTYLNTTPNEENPNWALLGVGITGYGIAYNPQVTTEKWIIHKSATSEVESYQRAGDVSQKCYKGDPVFEFINDLRRRAVVGAELHTQVLDIDRYDGTEAGAYKATKSEITIGITNYMAEEAVIEYTIHYNGDPVVGTVTFADGTPTFVEEA